MLKLKKSNTALIVTDMQNDFCSPEGYLAKNEHLDVTPIVAMAPRLSEFIDRIRNNVSLIIFTQQNESAEGAPKPMKNLFGQGKLKPKCLPDSWGFNFYLVRPERGDCVIEKRSWDAFTNPELKKILDANGIENIIMTGVFLNICIESTARRAFSEGYIPFIPRDLVCAFDPSQQEDVLVFFDHLIGTVANSED